MRLLRPLLSLLIALLVLGGTLIPTADAAPGTPAAAPTATPSPRKPLNPVRIKIGSIKLDQKIISVGLDKKHVPIVPKHDVGWYSLSARPGEGENIVLWGHVLRFRNAPKLPAPFARLREAKVGDAVVLYDSKGNAYPYTITEQVWVTPDQVEYILPVGTERVTMVSCIGDKVIANGEVVEMTHRLITIAEPVE